MTPNQARYAGVRAKLAATPGTRSVNPNFAKTMESDLVKSIAVKLGSGNRGGQGGTGGGTGGGTPRFPGQWRNPRPRKRIATRFRTQGSTYGG